MNDTAEEIGGATYAFRKIPGAVIFMLADAAQLDAFRFELKSAVAEFVKRSRCDDFTADDFLAALHAAPSTDTAAAWIITTDRYRLLGFALVELSATLARDEIDATVVGAYLWPKKQNLAISPVVNEMIEDWCRARGARRILLLTRRPKPRAWRRLGYKPFAELYAKTLEPSDGEQ